MSMEDTHPHLAQAFVKILRPLVKLLVRAGVTFTDFSELAKGVFVESAVRDTSGPVAQKSIARLAVMTGLAQSDVRRTLAAREKRAAPEPTMAAALAEIVQRWHTEAQFSGPYGVPLELEFDSGPRTFTQVVRMVGTKIHPQLLLNELMAAGVVVSAGPDFYKIVSRTFVFPVAMSPGMLEYFGNIMTDLATTVEYNIRPEAAGKRLERSVFADRPLTLGQLEAFEEFARSRVPDFISELDTWLARAASAAPPPGEEPLVDVGINVFQFVRDRAEEPPLESLYRTRDSLS